MGRNAKQNTGPRTRSTKRSRRCRKKTVFWFNLRLQLNKYELSLLRNRCLNQSNLGVKESIIMWRHCKKQQTKHGRIIPIYRLGGVTHLNAVGPALASSSQLVIHLPNQRAQNRPRSCRSTQKIELLDVATVWMLGTKIQTWYTCT